MVTTVPHCLSALIWATLSLQLGTYVCFPKLYWKAIFGKLILIFHLNLSMTLEWKGRPSLWASMTPSTQPEAGTFPDLEALCSMQHWAVCVCARGRRLMGLLSPRSSTGSQDGPVSNPSSSNSSQDSLHKAPKKKGIKSFMGTDRRFDEVSFQLNDF